LALLPVYIQIVKSVGWERCRKHYTVHRWNEIRPASTIVIITASLPEWEQFLRAVVWCYNICILHRAWYGRCHQANFRRAGAHIYIIDGVSTISEHKNKKSVLLRINFELDTTLSQGFDRKATAISRQGRHLFAVVF